MKRCPFCGSRTSRCIGCDDPEPIGSRRYCAKEDVFPHEKLDGSSHACAGCLRLVADDLSGVEGDDAEGTVAPWPAEDGQEGTP